MSQRAQMLGAIIEKVLLGMIRHRTRNRVLPFNPWNFDAEVGDIMVNHWREAYYLRQSRGRNKADAGELTPVQIKREGYHAVVFKEADGHWSMYWVPKKANRLEKPPVKRATRPLPSESRIGYARKREAGE